LHEHRCAEHEHDLIAKSNDVRARTGLPDDFGIGEGALQPRHTCFRHARSS
jgi:hypothetical protein